MKTIALPQKPEYIKGDKYEASFEIKGCHPGYGHTLGNALRRVLLSSLPGYAITQVKFKGVDHEFTTIPGVKEDIVQLILNLKKLRFKMHQDEPVKIKIKVKGSKEIKAKDISLPTNIEIVEPEAIVATLTDSKAELEMEMTVEKGIGYLPIENREEDTKEIGVIAIDALFTPIKKINYKVENMRVGKRTDYDKIMFMIKTDGSIDPKDAFVEAAKILVDQFGVIVDANEKKTKKKDVKESSKTSVKKEDESKKDKKTKKAKDNDEISVDELNLSNRVIGILKDNEIDTVGKLAKKSEEELTNLEGMGEKAIKDVKKAIGALGIILSEQE